MAAVKVRVLQDGTKRIVLLCTNLDTDETTPVAKLDLSATSHTATKAGGSVATASLDGFTLARVGVEKVTWSIGGFDGVDLLWDDATTDEQIVRLGPGEGKMEFANVVYPDTSPDVGDLLVQTQDAGAGGDVSYTIEIYLRKVWE